MKRKKDVKLTILTTRHDGTEQVVDVWETSIEAALQHYVLSCILWPAHRDGVKSVEIGDLKERRVLMLDDAGLKHTMEVFDDAKVMEMLPWYDEDEAGDADAE